MPWPCRPHRYAPTEILAVGDAYLFTSDRDRAAAGRWSASTAQQHGRSDLAARLRAHPVRLGAVLASTVVKDRAGVKRFAELIRTFIDMKIYHVQ